MSLNTCVFTTGMSSPVNSIQIMICLWLNAPFGSQMHHRELIHVFFFFFKFRNSVKSWFESCPPAVLCFETRESGYPVIVGCKLNTHKC